MSWFEGSRARLRLLFGRRATESRMDKEFRFHIEMETERLVREQKLDRDEARRRALVAFGGVEQHKEALREGRGTSWFNGLSLDLKLGFRMLAKYPGLTIIGGVAMAFGIWFGAVAIEMLGIVLTPKLPLPDANRIVEVGIWDVKANQPEGKALHDFQLWRSSVRSVTDLGAHRDLTVNVVGADSAAHPVTAAEITASAFRIAPDRPLHGRVLTESDERAGAPPVAVVGFALWRDRLGADPGIIGRSVRIGSGHATVVGVMPEGFGFPVAHELWMPFRANGADVAPRTGPSINVFGKLAPGVSLETAQAELASIGRRLAAESPVTHAQLQPRIRAYATPETPSADETAMTVVIYGFIIALLVVVCSTVALLLFARAASRESEILVRSALGATRGRLVTQLFAEALVLGGVAVVVALTAAQFALANWGRAYLEANYDQLPFWYEFNLSPTTVLIACGLAVLGAAIAGIIPARKITRGLGTQLKVGTAGGGGVKFGGLWTAVIVAQVALTVALPAVVMLLRSETKRVESYDMGFAEEQYLAVNVAIDDTSEARNATRARFSALLENFRQRLEAEPGVVGVTFVDELPGEYHDVIRVELTSLGEKGTHLVSTASIDPSYFEVLQQPPKAGRGFSTTDLRPDSRVVVVDDAFVDSVLKGRNPIGQRIRIGTRKQFDSAATDIPLYEVVGLVTELGLSPSAMPQRWPGLYFPVVPGSRGALQMIVHARGDPLSIAPRVRELATAVDPTLRIGTLQRMDQSMDASVWFNRLWTRMMIGLTAIALLLSLSGIYAVLSYTVARRTREIGVRVALGAGARRVITSIFRHPMTQVTGGVIAGVVLIILASAVASKTTQFEGTGVGVLTLVDYVVLVAYAILMLGVCALACIVPTRRALRVQPTEALRAE
ncbi:MAG TPA: ABC transporter permease [Gemmatimonadaceae bacterium]|nr:ABC transporter permease [Gemmatimonadaceae bacterium]